jgi:predicted N-acetyltransferase YhbS
MEHKTRKVRLMRAEDFDAVIGIDEKVLGAPRREYYERKFEKLFRSNDFVPASLVAEEEGGGVVGFVMGEVYIGEYGIAHEGAALDTIGVDPDWEKQGIGEQLINEFMDHLKSMGVQKVHTLVGLDDAKLTRFFHANQFQPSRTINLERDL